MDREVIEVIKSRKSVRRWSTTPVSRELIGEIVTAGESAPSSHDSKPTRSVVIDDPEIIDELLSNRFQLKESPYYINSRKWAEKTGIEKFDRVKSPPVIIAVCGDQDKCEDVSNLLINTSLSSQNILIAAHALGLGACWLYVYEEDDNATEDHVKRTLDLPENIRVLNLIALGYPDVGTNKTG